MIYFSKRAVELHPRNNNNNNNDKKESLKLPCKANTAFSEARAGVGLVPCNCIVGDDDGCTRQGETCWGLNARGEQPALEAAGKENPILQTQIRTPLAGQLSPSIVS